MFGTLLPGQARLDCFSDWGGFRNKIVLQLSLPLVCLSFYVAFLFCYMLLLWTARVRRLTPPLEALVRLQRSPRLAKVRPRLAHSAASSRLEHHRP